MRRVSLLGVILVCGFCGMIAAERFVDFFAPLTTDSAALSPDGKRLAYSFRHGNQISILTLDIDAPARAKCVVAVAKDDYATGYMQPDLHNNPARITWLGWTSAGRVVVESNIVFLAVPLRGTRSRSGVIFAFDHDGANARILYSGLDANGNVQIFGLTAGAPSRLLVQVDREWCTVDTDTGKARALSESQFDTMVETLKAQHERTTRRDEQAQARLRDLFPGYNVEILPHFGSSARTLARVSSCADAGSFVVYDPDDAKAWDIVRRAPVVEAIRSHRTQTFDLAGEHGERFTGTLVLPLNPRMKKAPLVLWMPERLGDRASNRYHPEVAALASMGFAVAVVDGLAWRNAANDEEADSARSFPSLPFRTSRDAPSSRSAEPMPAIPNEEIEHQLRACAVLARDFPVSARAVALFGHDATAQLAINAAINHPHAVRCIVAVDPWLDRFRGLISPETTRSIRDLREAPLGAAFLRSAARTPSGRHEAPNFAPTRGIAAALEKKGAIVDFDRLSQNYVVMGAEMKAAVFRDIENFLNAHLYRYSVELGEVDVVESDVPLPQR